MPGNVAMNAKGLRKRYGDTVALDGVDLHVERGTVCGLLGPNGAGKTTTIRGLATLQRFDGGQATVAGLDVATQATQVRYAIGLVGQHPAVDEVLDGHQNLAMFGRLYRLSSSTARRRADELLTQFGLADAGNKPVKTYSSGMRRRLDLAASMILTPAVLFLDEPTVGLDPRGRNQVWQAIRALAHTGTTVLLTTQHLDEADQLANQITVIDHGRVIAEGSPEQLKSRIGSDHLEVVVHDPRTLPTATRVLETVTGTTPELIDNHRTLSVPVTNRAGVLAEVIRTLDTTEVATEDLRLRRPTLDEVFLQLTGRQPTAAGNGTHSQHEVTP